MSKNRLYAIILIACLSGFIYLIYSFQGFKTSDTTVCLIKNLSGFPCPSCGTTRAVTLVFRGRFWESLQMNPFGILVSAIMTIVPFWILSDLMLKKESFFIFYKKAEAVLRRKGMAIPLIILVFLNWMWTIYKDL